MTRIYPSMVAAEGHRPRTAASPAPSGQGVSGGGAVEHVTDYVHPLPWKVSQRPKRSPQVRALPWQLLDANGETIGWFADGMAATLPAKAVRLAHAAVAAPAPSCAPGEVERLRAALEPFAKSILADVSTQSGWRFGFEPTHDQAVAAHLAYYGKPTLLDDLAIQQENGR